MGHVAALRADALDSKAQRASACLDASEPTQKTITSRYRSPVTGSMAFRWGSRIRRAFSMNIEVGVWVGLRDHQRGQGAGPHVRGRAISGP